MIDPSGHIPSGERRAWLLLTATLITVAGIHLYFRGPSQTSPLSPEEIVLTDRIQFHSHNKSSGDYIKEGNSEQVLRLKPFNPNTISAEEMRKMHLPENLLRGIIAYREKVGAFISKNDFKRIYALTPELKEQIIPYLLLPETESPAQPLPQEDYSDQKASLHERKLLELNTCDSFDLIKLRGIGPYYSRLILRYRESLGGFLNTEQLKEIKRLPDSTYLNIAPFLKVNPSLIRRLHINQLDEVSLAKHPYIQYKQAKAIVAYRVQHGPYSSTNELEKVLLLDQAFIQKIAPYIRWD